MGIMASQHIAGDEPPIYPPYFHRITLPSQPKPSPPTWTTLKPGDEDENSNAPPPEPTAHLIDFPSSPLSQSYTSQFALVIDDIFTPAECAAMVALAESGGPWIKAEVNGRVETNYRNSERILRIDEVASKWVFERLKPWMEDLGLKVLYEPRKGEGEGEGDSGRGSRSESLERSGGEKRFEHIVPRGVRLGLAKKMAAKVAAQGKGKGKGGLEDQEPIVRWEMTQVNPMLRFLKYGPGQFFQRHCDGHFLTSDIDGRDPSLPLEKSWITIQIYLCSEGLVGGSTSFWGRTGKDRNVKIDVEARQGRVLIFQQRELVHTGENVQRGSKITVRSEFMYKKIVEDAEGGK